MTGEALGTESQEEAGQGAWDDEVQDGWVLDSPANP